MLLLREPYASVLILSPYVIASALILVIIILNCRCPTTANYTISINSEQSTSIMSSSTTLSLSSISTASASAPNSNLMDTKNNNNENDTYSYIASLRKIEERYQCTDYIKVKESKDKHIIDGNCRARVCRWMFDIVDSLNMSRDTAVAAICNLDRFMCATKKATFDRKEYQLGKYVLSSHLEEQAQMYQYLKLLFYSCSDAL